MNTDDLISQFRHDPTAIPGRWPHLKAQPGFLVAELSTRDIAVRIMDPKTASLPLDREMPQVEFGIMSFTGNFHVHWFDRLNKEDLRCMAALLLQAADRMP